MTIDTLQMMFGAGPRTSHVDSSCRVPGKLRFGLGSRQFSLDAGSRLSLDDERDAIASSSLRVVRVESIATRMYQEKLFRSHGHRETGHGPLLILTGAEAFAASPRCAAEKVVIMNTGAYFSSGGNRAP
jgi:hypothetical protein